MSAEHQNQLMILAMIMELCLVQYKHLAELKQCQATAYEDKMKGVMDNKTFVLLRNQFKKECDQLKEAQQRIQIAFETVQKCRNGPARFKKEVESQAGIKFLTRDIVGQLIDWIVIYPEDRSVRPYKQKIEIYYHFIGKIEKIL